jgi:hypothetical protein
MALAGPSGSSTYWHFDLKKLAEGVAAIPVPGENSSHEIHDKVLPDVLPDTVKPLDSACALAG